MRRLVTCVTILVVGVATGQDLGAQEGAVELGIDADIGYNIIFDGDNLFQVSLPFGGGGGDIPRALHGFRAGFFLSDVLSLEPSLAFGFLDGSGSSLVRFGIATTILHHFSADPTASRFFVGAGPGFNVLKDIGHQFNGTALVGVKVPLVERLAFRTSVGGAYFFGNEDYRKRLGIFGTLGFSFFTK